NRIQSRLYQIINLGFEPRKLIVWSEKNEEYYGIYATDTQSMGRLQIMMVTNLDAVIGGQPQQQLADRYSAIIKNALIRAVRERESAFLIKQSVTSGILLIIAIAVSTTILFFQKRLKQQQLNLQSVVETTENLSLSKPETTKNPLDRHKLIRTLLQIAQIAIWVVTLSWIAGMFPYSRDKQLWFLAGPVKIIILWSLAPIVIRFAKLIVDRILLSWQNEQQHLTNIDPNRLAKRFSTYSIFIQGIVNFIIISIAILLTLIILRIPIIPVLASAGILGFAISFGSQTLVRDIINGIFIIFEDQFAVGDYVDLGSGLGIVENMTLRVTQLRIYDGSFTTIPNSQIQNARNYSRDRSRVSIVMDIAYEHDATKTLEIIRACAEKLAKDPEWKDLIIDPVDLLRVIGLSHSGMRIIFWMNVLPGKHFAVAGEFRLRLKKLLEEHGIRMGVPQQKISVENN
ncbi:MAG: mechanosensitive ion channel family protein, partial [Prochloraceae cyanobacterium]|nr:mechanosensitive ion channel family protein [Prochloraceae cyanobacterium]